MGTPRNNQNGFTNNSSVGVPPEDWMPLFYANANKLYTDTDQFKADATNFYNELWRSRGFVPPQNALETKSFLKNYSEPKNPAADQSWSSYFSEKIWGTPESTTPMIATDEPLTGEELRASLRARAHAMTVEAEKQ